MLTWMDKWIKKESDTYLETAQTSMLLITTNSSFCFPATKHMKHTHRTDMLVQFCAPYLCDKRKWRVAHSHYGWNYIHAWDWPFPYILSSVQLMNNVRDVTFCNVWQKEYQVCKTWKNDNNSWSNKILMQSTCNVQ